MVDHSTECEESRASALATSYYCIKASPSTSARACCKALILRLLDGRTLDGTFQQRLHQRARKHQQANVWQGHLSMVSAHQVQTGTQVSLSSTDGCHAHCSVCFLLRTGTAITTMNTAAPNYAGHDFPNSNKNSHGRQKIHEIWPFTRTTTLKSL